MEPRTYSLKPYRPWLDDEPIALAAGSGTCHQPAGSPEGGQFTGCDDEGGDEDGFVSRDTKVKGEANIEASQKAYDRAAKWGVPLEDLVNTAVPDQEVFPNVTVQVDGPDMHVIASSDDHDGQMYRIFSKNDDGELEMDQHVFILPKQLRGTGKGTDIFLDQIENADRVGVTKVHTFAERAGGSDGTNGYYTWARLGYDTKMTGHWTGREGEGSAVPPGRPERLSDLMKTPEGRAWWRENGFSIHLEFDMKKDSLSRRVLHAYKQERKKRG